jgi:hypothetical protein
LRFRIFAVATAIAATVLTPVGLTLSPASAATPTPIIVDTDMYSDADDAGALASAFALQQTGEAKVVAVTINTRQNRPEVANNSWKCAAAIAQFYNAGTTPLGAATPRKDDTQSPFTTGCAARAAADTATPANAVDVLKTALAAQADNSVVIAETGYPKNLADLIATPDGKALVAKKVKMLVIMAGGYPNGNHENNVNGDADSARAIADTWPTKVVWSGVEIGDLVDTGGSLTSTHPASSPVRISYEAFGGPNKAIKSWDLTAVYHAVRSGDAVMTEVGPGRNEIDNFGDATYSNNTWVNDPMGTQYYLKLNSEAALENSLNALLNTLPVAPSTPGPSTPATPTTQPNQPNNAAPAEQGYRVVGADGLVLSYGVQGYGDLADVELNDWIINASRTASGRGYWLLGADGGIFAFGDAQFYGSMGGKPLNAPVVAMAPTATGAGYWLVAEDGGIFAFGDAKFYGSMGGKPLNEPIVGITASASGNGYRLVAADGGIFAFGDAQFYGSMGGQSLNAPVVAMTPSATGNGYRMVAADGGIFAFGDAQFYGSMGGKPLNLPIIGMQATASGAGYWCVALDGGVFAFGDAPFVGSAANEDLWAPIIAMA